MPHRRRSPAEPVTSPDDDDILSEILLRLPPQPSSLPRASLVCKRWLRLVTEPYFRRRFRARHRNPPLLGVFEDCVSRPGTDPPGYPTFRSVMGSPDLIPPERFCLPLDDGAAGRRDREPSQWGILGCRHGRVLLHNRAAILLWEPLAGDQRWVRVPPKFDGEGRMHWNAAVLCAAAGDRSHAHGGFGPCSLRVALVGRVGDPAQMSA